MFCFYCLGRSFSKTEQTKTHCSTIGSWHQVLQSLQIYPPFRNSYLSLFHTLVIYQPTRIWWNERYSRKTTQFCLWVSVVCGISVVSWCETIVVFSTVTDSIKFFISNLNEYWETLHLYCIWTSISDAISLSSDKNKIVFPTI